MILILAILIGCVGLRGSAFACSADHYECDNGRCVALERVCDYRDDCGDGSDERRYEVGFKCNIGSQGNRCVLPQRLTKDGVAQCNDASDLCLNNASSSCHKCFVSNDVIKTTQLCDGVVDCPDLSDECLCGRSRLWPLCANLRAGGTFSCDNGKTTLKQPWVCDSMADCDDGVDEAYCRQTPKGKAISCRGYNRTKTITAFACDGVFECDDLSDECASNCTSKPAFCSVASAFASTVGQQEYSCVTKGGTSGNLTFTNHDICDGKWLNCFPRIAEEEASCPGRFYCKQGNTVSVDVGKVCDGTADCDDGSDETNCTFRHYCESGSPISVPNTFVMDGVNDCSDGSDECPQSLDQSRGYSSRYEMISSVGLRVWIWFIALVGMAANCVVFVHTFKNFRDLRNTGSGLARQNYFLVMNLNMADLLMSVYLLILAGKSAQFSGHYCQVELAWRTSFLCNFIGPLSILSAQASLFTLVVMTSQRLHAVFNPVTARTSRRCYISTAVACVWLLSFVLAAVPAMHPNVFVDGLWMPSKYFSEPIVRTREIASLVSVLRVLLADNSTAFAFPSELIAYDQYLRSKGFVVNGPYGYYSENSLCAPHFYTPATDNGWYYSTLLVTVNMVAFLYVAVSYVLVYWKSTVGRVQSSISGSFTNRMQRRIMKLVLANFACWLPICIASYVQLAFPREFAHPLFAITAAFLFPINSVVNPLLYSDVFENVFAKARNSLKKRNTHASSSNLDQANLSEVKGT